MATSLSLKFCKKNMEKFGTRVHDYLTKKYPEVTIEVSDCLDVCGLCTDVPFVHRNGSIIAGRDERDLVRKLDKGMEFLDKPRLVTIARPVIPKKSGAD